MSACGTTSRDNARYVLLVKTTNRSDRYIFVLITMDTHATAAQTIERYDERWAIEVSYEDAKQITGVGQARNRVPKAVERTVPFGSPRSQSRSIRRRSWRSCGVIWTSRSAGCRTRCAATGSAGSRSRSARGDVWIRVPRLDKPEPATLQALKREIVSRWGVIDLLDVLT